MPLSPASSRSSLQVVTVDLSSAQILALFTTPVTLVAAQGAGMIVAPVQFYTVYTFGGVAYTVADSVVVRYAGSTRQLNDYSSFLGRLDQAASCVQVEPAITNASGTPPTLAEATNTAVQVAALTGNPTLGNGTLRVVTTFHVVRAA